MTTPLSTFEQRRIRNEISTLFTQAKPDDCGDTRVDYTHHLTGRRFCLSNLQEGVYYVSEYKPNGRLLILGHYIDHPSMCNAVAADPNNTKAILLEEGVDPETVISIGGGFGTHAITYDTVDAAAQAVVTAIEANTWLKEHLTREEYEATRTDRDRMIEALNEARASVAYWQERVAIPTIDHGVLKGASGTVGALRKEYADKILAFLNAPTAANWEACYGVSISPCKSVWRAWVEGDPEAPRSKPLDADWPRIPDPVQLLDHVRTAIERDRAMSAQRLLEAQEAMEAAERQLTLSPVEASESSQG